MLDEIDDLLQFLRVTHFRLLRLTIALMIDSINLGAPARRWRERTRDFTLTGSHPARNFSPTMPATASKIRFKAKLLRPAESEKDGSWTFLILPKASSAKLPSRGMTAIEGTLNGFRFQATLEPDGRKSHWLKVDRKLRERASAEPGDDVTLEIAPAAEEPEVSVPADLKKALAAAAPKVRALWSDITPVARRDWIHWITSAKQPETRVRRIKNACSMLGSGKRRPCCFDRSGFYSKSLSAPKAAI
jgi:hypothetical protein